MGVRQKVYFQFMGDHIIKIHNKSASDVSFGFPFKHSQSVIKDEIGVGLKQICLDILERYEVYFIEVGYEPDHIHYSFFS